MSTLSVDLALTEPIPTPEPNLIYQQLDRESLIDLNEGKLYLTVLLILCTLILFVSMLFLLYLFNHMWVMGSITDMIYIPLQSYTVKLKFMMMNLSSK